MGADISCYARPEDRNVDGNVDDIAGQVGDDSPRQPLQTPVLSTEQNVQTVTALDAKSEELADATGVVTDESTAAETFPKKVAWLNPDWDLSHQSKCWSGSLFGKLKVESDLIALHRSYPFFTLPGHYLHRTATECADLLKQEDGKAASHAIEMLAHAVQQEQLTVQALHELFCSLLFEARDSDRSCMRSPDVSFMLHFFGIPSERMQLLDFLDAFDTDRDKQLNLEEFQIFVGRMGGSLELFESRKTTSARGISGRRALLDPSETIQDASRLCQAVLAASGIEASRQQFWRIVAPSSELRALTALKPCHQNVLKTMRGLAKINHERALPKLQDRMRKLGFHGREMEITLAWIREVPPILIQIDLNRFSSYFMNDTHYRNQFETSTSSGLLNAEARKKWETNLFKGAYDGPDVQPFDRCKYGCLNVMNDYRGVAGTEFYGESYLVLKDVRLRCTFTPLDSGNLEADKVAVIDYFAHQLLSYTDPELLEVVRVANSTETVVGSSTMIRGLRYKEAQIHGEICFTKHVDRLCAADAHNTSYWPAHLQDICSKHGWKFSWISNEKFRMEEEEAWQRLGTRFWKERMHLELTDEDLKSSEELEAQKKLKLKQARAAKVAATSSAPKTDSAESCRKREAAKQAEKQAAEAAQAAANTARAQASDAVRDARGELELAWAMLLSQDAMDAAALVANLLAARESREGDIRYLLMSVTTLAEGTEQKAWTKLGTEFSALASVWEAQALTGMRQNYQQIATQMCGVTEMVKEDLQSARFVLDDVMQKIYARKLSISAGVKDAVFAVHNSQQLAQQRWELAARLESLASCHEKLSSTEDLELLALVRACKFETHLEERVCKLLKHVPKL